MNPTEIENPQLYLDPVTSWWRVAYVTPGRAGGVCKMEQIMCSLVGRHRRFGRTCCPNPQSYPEDGEARSKLCLHFDQQNWGDNFLVNNISISTNYTAVYASGYNSSSLRLSCTSCHCPVSIFSNPKSWSPHGNSRSEFEQMTKASPTLPAEYSVCTFFLIDR